MIAYIKGKLISIQEEAVIVDVNGIGYEIICANPFVFQASLNQNVFIHTYHHVREDAQILYGFKNDDEKYLFTKLISVSGIGPKSGLAIQGSVNVSDFVSAVEREDEKYLTQFPGVGKKTSRQIILDLKGKLTEFLTISSQVDEPSTKDQAMSTAIHEAKEVLKSLGYTDQEIRAITPELRESSALNTDEVIKKALALLMKN